MATLTNEKPHKREDISGGIQRKTTKFMQKASEVVYQTPEVRSEKVAALEESVEQGTYEVDSQKVANSLIKEILLEK